MEAGVGTTPIAGAGGSTPAVTSPQYNPPPPPFNPMPQSPMQPAMEDGGAVGDAGGRKNPFKDFFSGINWIDTAISAFIIGSVLYVVYYHKQKLMLEKVGYTDLSTRVQRVETQLANAKKSEMNATGGRGTMRRKRSLVTL